MPDSDATKYVRPIDFDAIAALGPDERMAQRLLDRNSGATECAVSLIRTPAGGGSPRGLHVHDFEQHYYVIEGGMGVEIEGTSYDVPPGSIVWIPRGVPHRNWTSSDQPTLHLSINVPAPDPTLPSGRAV